jgi:hypothetical protein
MPEELRLPVLAVTVLLWYLMRSLWQLRSEQRTSPTVVWRETAGLGWSEWRQLVDVSSTATHDSMFASVCVRAHATATAVQFAVIAHPDDAPDYTIRVLFMSDVREPSSGRALVSTGCEG